MRISARKVFLTLTLLAIPLGFYFTFIYAPVEKQMGIVQKIFYWHVPSAWMAFLGYTIVFGCGPFYLWLKEPKIARLALSAAEVGFLFTTLVLITGPLWAKPVWGVWWSWDPRLTTTLLLGFLYFAYLVLDRFFDDRAKIDRYRAILGIVGFLDIPLIHLSVTWWRTIHPKPVVLSPEGLGSGLHPMMHHALWVNAGVFLLIFVTLISYRLEVENLQVAIRNRQKPKESPWTLTS